MQSISVRSHWIQMCPRCRRRLSTGSIHQEIRRALTNSASESERMESTLVVEGAMGALLGRLRAVMRAQPAHVPPPPPSACKPRPLILEDEA